MTTPSPTVAPSPVRPFYWSVRRELWEHRSIFIAPLAAAGVVLFGFLISTRGLIRAMDHLVGQDPINQARMLAAPFGFAAMVVIVTAAIVGVAYTLGALYGERRDRSILFWKSLPVSDLVTVLAKVFVVMVVLPMVTAVVIIALQLVMMLVSTAILMANGPDASLLWARLPLLQMWLVTLYGLAAMSLWYAPIWAWNLLVSGWARRVTFLWAVLPPIGLCVIEFIAFQTSYLSELLHDRLGGFKEAFNNTAPGGFLGLVHMDPVGFLTTPGLWGGLIVAAGFLAATVWQRRYREPI